jgi:hypothetical protein
MTKDKALKLALEKVANALPAYIEGTPAREYLAVIHSALAAPVQEPVVDFDPNVLRQQMIGRAEFLRNRGEVKTPQLLELAAKHFYTTPPTAPVQNLQCFHCQDTIETLNDKVMHFMAQRQWVGLTAADFDWLEQVFGDKVSNNFVFADIVCVIQAKLKEKNA